MACTTQLWRQCNSARWAAHQRAEVAVHASGQECQPKNRGTPALSSAPPPTLGLPACACPRCQHSPPRQPPGLPPRLQQPAGPCAQPLRPRAAPASWALPGACSEAWWAATPPPPQCRGAAARLSRSAPPAAAPALLISSLRSKSLARVPSRAWPRQWPGAWRRRWRAARAPAGAGCSCSSTR